MFISLSEYLYGLPSGPGLKLPVSTGEDVCTDTEDGENVLAVVVTGGVVVSSEIYTLCQLYMYSLHENEIIHSYTQTDRQARVYIHIQIDKQTDIFARTLTHI